MKQYYTKAEFDKLIAGVSQRSGWNFSSMSVDRAPVPWDYISEVKKYLKPTDKIIDIGTGGGERFIELSPAVKYGLGTDIDPDMIKTAAGNAMKTDNIKFLVSDYNLENIDKKSSNTKWIFHNSTSW